MMPTSVGAWDQLSAIQRAAEEIVDLLDDFHPVGPLQRSDLASARNHVASVNAALDRLNDSIRKGFA